MKKIIILLLLIPLVNSCSKESFDENEIVLLKSARNEKKYSDGSTSSNETSYYYENSYLQSNKYELSKATGIFYHLNEFYYENNNLNKIVHKINDNLDNQYEFIRNNQNLLETLKRVYFDDNGNIEKTITNKYYWSENNSKATVYDELNNIIKEELYDSNSNLILEKIMGDSSGDYTIYSYAYDNKKSPFYNINGNIRKLGWWVGFYPNNRISYKQEIFRNDLLYETRKCKTYSLEFNSDGYPTSKSSSDDCFGAQPSTIYYSY